MSSEQVGWGLAGGLPEVLATLSAPHFRVAALPAEGCGVRQDTLSSIGPRTQPALLLPHGAALPVTQPVPSRPFTARRPSQWDKDRRTSPRRAQDPQSAPREPRRLQLHLPAGGRGPAYPDGLGWPFLARLFFPAFISSLSWIMFIRMQTHSTGCFLRATNFPLS